MSNSKGIDAIHLRQLRAFAENLCLQANRHCENRNYVVAHALYGRALEAAQRIDTPDHKENGNALVTRIQKDRQAVYELLRRAYGSPEKALLEKAQKRGQVVLRMAIEYLPESQRNTAVRYLLIAYGRSGKAVSTSPFHGLDQLLETLTLAGISLEKDEERSLIRDDGSEQHSVLIASNVELRDSQCEVLGLLPVAEN